jgi:hypothetical protein
MNRATFRVIPFVIVAMSLAVAAIGNPVIAPHHDRSVELITGLDGGLYEPYRPGTIERVQRALIARELYRGPVNGILDEPTIKAIYAFQKMTRTLQVCGVPTPRTRKLLEQGSHTDP